MFSFFHQRGWYDMLHNRAVAPPKFFSSSFSEFFFNDINFPWFRVAPLFFFFFTWGKNMLASWRDTLRIDLCISVRGGGGKKEKETPIYFLSFYGYVHSVPEAKLLTVKVKLKTFLRHQ